MKFAAILVCMAVLALGGAAWLRIEHTDSPRSVAVTAAPSWPYGDGEHAAKPIAASSLPGPSAAASTPAAAQTCDAPGQEVAAGRNAATLAAADWPMFGRIGEGWEMYQPLIGREIASACAGDTPAFAKALRRWQSAHRLPATGILDATDFELFRSTWIRRRPFVIASEHGVCPAAPDEATLAESVSGEAWGGPVRLRPGALAAWRAMVAAARNEEPALAADPRLLRLISGYRSPLIEAARCLIPGICGGPERAHCSAHRTGLAVDLYLGSAPGFDPASTYDANRLWQSQRPAYRWMVANADRFGFVNYPFEPWHWEWTGEPV